MYRYEYEEICDLVDEAVDECVNVLSGPFSCYAEVKACRKALSAIHMLEKANAVGHFNVMIEIPEETVQLIVEGYERAENTCAEVRASQIKARTATPA